MDTYMDVYVWGALGEGGPVALLKRLEQKGAEEDPRCDGDRVSP